MSTTTFHEGNLTRTLGGHTAGRCPDELLGRYQACLDQERLSWTEHHRLIRPLGSGGQGVVFLSERRGTDDFTLPVALKVFSPERYEDERAYDEAMGRIAQVAAHVAQIQQDNLLDVYNWVEHHRIRMMEMEWIDGYDLSRLLTRKMLDWLVQRVSNRRWSEINEVVVTAGKVQPRLKPGIAMAIIRDCLAALAALHRGRRDPRRREALEHHAQAHRDREDRGHRVGLRAEQRPAEAGLHAGLRRSGGPGQATQLAAIRPGQPGLRAHRDALRRSGL